MSTPPLELHALLVRRIRELGFHTPTPIQTQAIPLALQGRDLLASAATGSGKTAAFLLPTIQRLLGSPRRKGPRALVLAPTRELAAQVADDLAELAAHTRIRGLAVYGGVATKPQERAFRTGIDVLVATPGRLLDHLGHSYARLDGVETLIIDEADRMLDMGFLPDIRRILKRLPPRRQSLFFSATMPKEVKKLARDILHDPVTIAVERRAVPATGVRQQVIPVAQPDKSRLLLDVLARDGVQSVLCFTRTKRRADRLASFLDKSGIRSAHIHGNRSQSQRQKALAAFRQGHARILVATDIAARGIDIEHLSHVINYDVPKAADDYIHRVGRTARASRTGDAITFVAFEERDDLANIEKALDQEIPRAPRFRRRGAPQATADSHPREPQRAASAKKRAPGRKSSESAARRTPRKRARSRRRSSSPSPKVARARTRS